MRKIHISDWERSGGLELIRDDLLSPKSIAHTRASLLVSNPQSINTEDSPSGTHRTCCLGTGPQMWPKTHAKSSDLLHFPTTQRVRGLHFLHILDVVASGVRSGKNNAFKKGIQTNYFDNSLLHPKLYNSISVQSQVLFLLISSLKPESNLRRRKVLPVKQSP